MLLTVRGRATAVAGRLVTTAAIAALALVGIVGPAGADEVAQVATTTTTTTVGYPTTGDVDEGVDIAEDIAEDIDDVPAVTEEEAEPFDEPPGDGPGEGGSGDDDGENDADDDDEGDEQPPAQPEIPDEFGFAVEVDAGLRGQHRAGQPVSVSVQLAAQRLISGELRLVVTTDERTISSEIEIEVPGSSTKEFVLVTPTVVRDQDDLSIEIVVEGELVVDHPITVASDATTELVGVMSLVSAADSLPESAELAVGRSTALLAGIDAEVLGAGLGALSGFDIIVATGADIDALSGREYDALAAWITDGGHLLVDEIDGPVPRLPVEWQPSADRAQVAGRGLVRLTGGAAKAGEWDTILMPTPIDTTADAAGYDLRTFAESLAGIDSVLSEDAGFSLPSITGIIIFLGVYVIVVGPLSHVLLRRRGRTRLLWVAVPMLALLATVGVVALGGDLRDNTRASHLTVISTGAGTDVAVTQVLVDSDEAGVQVPRGWTARVSDELGGTSLPPATVELGDDRSTARLELTSGEFAIVGARGPIEQAGLAVTATSDRNGHVTGVVTNRTDATLHDVAVLVSAYGRSFGSLAPGEEREFSLSGVDGFELRADATGILWENGRLAEVGVWEQVFDSRGGLNANPVGAITAVGWTDGLDAPVRTADGNRIRSGRTVLLTNEPIAGAGHTNMAARLEMVRGPAGSNDADTGTLFGLQATYQAVIDWNTDDERLAITVPRFASDMAIWNGDRWRSVSTNGREETRVLRIEDVVIDGVIHVRMEIDRRQIFEFGNGRTLTVESVPDDGDDA